MSEINKDLYVPQKAEIIEAKMVAELDKYFKIKLLDSPGLKHRPGQFVMISIFGVGEMAISLPSVPDDETNEFEVVIRNVGNVTQAIHNLKVGDIVGIRGPYGTQFSYEGYEGKDILFIAAGLGLVPLRSFIQQVVNDHDKFRKITILYGMKTSKEFLFKDELDKWNAVENVDVQLTVDKADEGWEHSEGLITTLIPLLEVDAENTLVAIVGPPVVYKFVILALDEKKVPHDNIVISLERRMKCGEGKCGNCQIQDIYVCKDGPVFNYGKIEYLKEAIF